MHAFSQSQEFCNRHDLFDRLSDTSRLPRSSESIILTFWPGQRAHLQFTCMGEYDLNRRIMESFEP